MKERKRGNNNNSNNNNNNNNKNCRYMYTLKQRFYEYEKNLELCSSCFFFNFSQQTIFMKK